MMKNASKKAIFAPIFRKNWVIHNVWNYGSHQDTPAFAGAGSDTKVKVKFEIRISKSETNPNYQNSNVKNDIDWLFI